jgi:four helix bundle protein
MDRLFATHFRDLSVYQRAFDVAMRIYRLSKRWPAEERYSLTDQIRRSSRSVCASIAEAWRKRRYPSHFVSKLSDADAEAAETQNWLQFALECGCLSADEHRELWAEYDQIAGGLVKMMSRPETWCGPSTVREEAAEYSIHSEDSAS